MTLTTALQVFLTGTVGGIILELFHWYGLRREGKLPKYLHSPFYWGISFAMALVGGFLAWIYFGSRAEGILALHVGLSTPLILQKLTTAAFEKKGGKGDDRGPLDFFRW